MVMVMALRIRRQVQTRLTDRRYLEQKLIVFSLLVPAGRMETERKGKAQLQTSAYVLTWL